MTERQFFSVEQAADPIDAPVAKLGGQPVWLEPPQWPISRNLHEPMTFIGQFEVPQGWLTCS